MRKLVVVSIKYLFPAVLAVVMMSSCSTRRQLSYLNNLPEEDAVFPMDVPDYIIQNRDILYLTIKAMTTDGTITDFLQSNRYSSSTYMTNESGYYVYGYNVDTEGNVNIPAIGAVKVTGLTLEEARKKIQETSNKVFRNATVECKLLSFKFTVIGEVNRPGTYVNYNNYLTVLEAIGRAGGIGDYGRRDRVQVIRPVENGTKTFHLSLQDKNLLSNEAYYLLPNDIVIVEPQPKKIFNLNLSALSFLVSSVTSAITTTLLIINYVNNK